MTDTEGMRAFIEELLAYPSVPGEEAPAQAFVRERLAELGFDPYEWGADAERLATHPSFPDDPAAIQVADRPSVAGVLEVGDPDAGPTLVLNGHVDVVPAGGAWSGDPFVPTWNDDGTELTARGAADMKSGLGACVFAALAVADAERPPDGRIVVESVVGEEEGGIGAAAAALDNPYPFERDAAIVAEPTSLRPVVATEGTCMVRIGVRGRSAHAATRWEGESVLPHFERIRAALADLESERAERVSYPGYEGYPVPWPICVGRVRAGDWASTVPADLVAEVRVGVAPGETVAAVEREVREAVAAVAREDDWLSEHPPTVERFEVQFEPATVDPDEPVVGAVQGAMAAQRLDAVAPIAVTYGTDARHYIGAGVPTVVFGPGDIEQAHFPDETIRWGDVERAAAVLEGATRRYLSR